MNPSEPGRKGEAARVLDSSAPFDDLIAEYKLYDNALVQMSGILASAPDPDVTLQLGQGTEFSALLWGARTYSDSDLEWAERCEILFEYLYQFSLAQADLDREVPLEE